MVLCFGFKIMTSQWCFYLMLSSADTNPGHFSSYQWENWYYTRTWEVTKPGQLIQTGQRHIPYHVVPCWMTKRGELAAPAQARVGQQLAGGEKLRHASFVWFILFAIIFWWLSFSFLSPLFPHLFLFPIKLSLSQPTSCHTAQFSSLSHYLGAKVCMVFITCGVKPQFTVTTRWSTLKQEKIEKKWSSESCPEWNIHAAEVRLWDFCIVKQSSHPPNLKLNKHIHDI